MRNVIYTEEQNCRRYGIIKKNDSLEDLTNGEREGVELFRPI